MDDYKLPLRYEGTLSSWDNDVKTAAMNGSTANSRFFADVFAQSDVHKWSGRAYGYPYHYDHPMQSLVIYSPHVPCVENGRGGFSQDNDGFFCLVCGKPDTDHPVYIGYNGDAHLLGAVPHPKRADILARQNNE